MKRNLIVFAPHPDDEVLGCGGTMALRIQEGFDAHVVFLTDGASLFSALLGIHADPSPEEVKAARNRESRQATGILGFDQRQLHFLDYAPNSLEHHHDEVVGKAVEFIDRLTPDEIYITNPHEAHPEHRQGNAIVRMACARAKRQPRLLQYIIALKPGVSLADVPEKILRVDISPVRTLKARAVDCFKFHLEIQSPRQTRPLTDFREYQEATEEIFLLDSPP